MRTTTEFPTTHEYTAFFQTTEGQEALQNITHEGLRLVVEKFGIEVPDEVYEAFQWNLPVGELAKVRNAYLSWMVREAKKVASNVYDEARELLGVAPSATAKEIKAAWKRAAVANHPDMGGSTEVMQQINAAYELLTK